MCEREVNPNKKHFNAKKIIIKNAFNVPSECDSRSSFIYVYMIHCRFATFPLAKTSPSGKDEIEMQMKHEEPSS
jgi:hypothetical protein